MKNFSLAPHYGKFYEKISALNLMTFGLRRLFGFYCKPLKHTIFIKI